jgi:hypothetical protein
MAPPEAIVVHPPGSAGITAPTAGAWTTTVVLEEECAAEATAAVVTCLWRIDTVAVKRPKIRETRCDYEL